MSLDALICGKYGIYKEDLDKFKYQVCGDSPKEIIFHPSCHEKQNLQTVSYDADNGCIIIRCGVCDKMMARIAVASKIVINVG
jgi:hypothetical protein